MIHSAALADKTDMNNSIVITLGYFTLHKLFWSFMERLNLVFIAENQDIVVSTLAQLIYKQHCHIAESRLTVLGNQLAGVMRVTGNWNAIAKIESALNELNLQGVTGLVVKRDSPSKIEGQFLPYVAQIVSLDAPGVVYEVMRFFSNQTIQILDLQTDPFTTNHSATHMLTLSLRINVPADLNIADLRDQFMVLCDDFNMDGLIEPEKR